uniref:5'-nucleotidase n=1 Tax=Strongyloides venezuelensis TaxID=75913 RepID=A0A0K0F6T0_STRVS
MEYLLKNPNVHIRDKAAVARKLTRMSHDGRNGLMVISDFDFTLSKYSDKDGNRCWATHGVFDSGAKKVYPDLTERLQRLKEKYIKIEFCPTLTSEEKSPYMVTWWNSSHDEILKTQFTYELIESFIKESKIELRDGCVDFIENLNTNKVPLIVFSAGIGNIIEIYFKQTFKEVPNNIHIISNMIEFNENNVAVKFSEPLIHTFCKNSTVIRKEQSFFHKVSNRSNILLLGDSLGDLTMDAGVENEGVALKIGFLNFDFQNLLPKYCEGYDIVIVNDQSMSVPDHIINVIEEKSIISLPVINPLISITDTCHSSADSSCKTDSDKVNQTQTITASSNL